MSTNELQPTTGEPDTNTAELLDPENPRIGFHAQMNVDVEIPLDGRRSAGRHL